MKDTIVNVHLPAGTSVEIKIPVTDEGGGHFPYQETTITFGGTTYDLLNGFAVSSTDVGTIEDITGDELGVKYTHLLPSENKIMFFSDNGERATLHVINTPIHDHSSIVQGGPAFGTYYSEVEDT